MSSMEVATGWVTGGAVGTDDRVVHGLTPAQALGEAIRPALLRGPCVVEFSGGRDSSVVLAVACDVARREGLALPIPFTRRYPGLPEADEDEWQELVIRHLGLTEWVRHVAPDEMDLLGSHATASLRNWGLLWPPSAHTRQAELALARGGSLLSGEGGDEVFGPQRLAVLRLLASRKLPMSRANVRQVALSVAPRRIRVERYRRRFELVPGFPWLQAGPLRRFTSALAEDAAAEPLDWRTSVRRHPWLRGVHLALHTLDLVAADADVLRLNPLLSTEFLGALCEAGGVGGFSDRTTALQRLFPDLLPAPVLARTTKCRFNRAVFGEQSRAFASNWTGKGVDAELVNVDALKGAWSAPEPHAMSFTVLQSCWLAENG